MIYQVHIKQRVFEAAVLKLDISYGELADRLGIHRAYLSNIKNEKLKDFRPSRELRKKICEVLGVKPEKLFVIKTAKKPKRKKKATPLNGRKRPPKKTSRKR